MENGDFFFFSVCFENCSRWKSRQKLFCVEPQSTKIFLYGNTTQNYLFVIFVIFLFDVFHFLTFFCSPLIKTGSSISWKCKYGKMKKHMLSQFSILLDNYVRGVVGDFEESLCDGEGGGMVIVEEDEENEEEEISKERREREERREEARRARRRRARKERRRQEKLVKKKTEKLKAKKKKEKAVKKGGGAGGGGGGGGGGAGGEQEYVLTSLAGEVVKFSDGNMKEMYINMGNQDKCVFCSSVFGPYKTPSNRRYGLFLLYFLYCFVLIYYGR